MTENWKDVPGYEGAYQVSDQGRVRSLARISVAKNGRLMPVKGTPEMKQVANESGHRRVNLAGTLYYVHRLVMLAFVGPPPPGEEVRHGETGPSDNRLENLQYGTRSQNMYDKVQHGNHWQASKTHCPRGHALVDRNNTPQRRRAGRRECLACSQARAHVRYRGLPTSSIQAVSDQRYATIMETE